jgi:non-haem Fe2+, alpha-ketoglutarate-dependent halogenase
MALSEMQVKQYEEQGFLAGVSVMDGNEAAQVRALFDALEAREGRDKAQIGLLDRHFDERFIWEIATRPEILDAVEAILGPDLLLLATHFFCKYGRDEKWVAWHQDVTYWGLEPPTALTAWYAVDDSDTENGCMRCIPGTHAEGIRSHGKADAAGNLLSINQAVPVSSEEELRAVDMPLKAGEISLHDGALVHGSLPNRSERRRCGLTLRYVPASVRPAGGNSLGKPWRPILVRGEDRYDHFRPHTRHRDEVEWELAGQ